MDFPGICSARLDFVIKLLSEYSILAIDVIEGTKLQWIAAAPSLLLDDKVKFKKNNLIRRKRQDGIIRVEHVGGRRKNRASRSRAALASGSASAAVVEDEQQESLMADQASTAPADDPRHDTHPNDDVFGIAQPAATAGQDQAAQISDPDSDPEPQDAFELESVDDSV